MKRHVTALVLAVAALAAFTLSAQATPLTAAFTYQGSIDRSGISPTDSCTFQFRLYDSLTGGVQVGPTIVTPATLLQGGQFSVPLDFGFGIFDGNQRWLEISVHCPGDGGLTTLTPRQSITATPYSLYALSGAGGSGGFTLPFSGTLTNTTQDAFRIQNNGTSGSFITIHGISTSSTNGAAAIYGEAKATTGSTVAISASAISSPGGTAYVGQASTTGAWLEALNTAGDANGVIGVTHSTSFGPAGVKGLSLATTGSTVGVWGMATGSPLGTGVVGSGSSTGGNFISSDAGSPSNDYSGVRGTAVTHPGVLGISTSNSGIEGRGVTGVIGLASAGSGGNGLSGTADGGGAGVYGTSPTWAGVYGNAAAIGVRGFSAAGHGVEGVANSAAGIAVFGDNPLGNGVWGQSSAAGNSGVVGISYNASGVGVWAQNNAGGVALLANGLAQVRTLQILGADLAESFPVRGGKAEPGSVVMISGGGEGELAVCDQAYCTRVAGVVSGAHGLEAAVVLKGASFNPQGHEAIAMSGRVWVRCDASTGAIRPGDLLTTSATPGCAMRAADRERAYGAILGKAMTSLEEDTGLVLVLVNLQ